MTNRSTQGPQSSPASPISLGRLRACANAEEFKLHVAAVEWTLHAPITIRSEADVISRKSWAPDFKPFAHQIQNLIDFCKVAPVALLADDVGLGKTISAGLILSELRARRRVARTLVVAPRLLLEQWMEELAAKFNIPSHIATGTSLQAALTRRTPVVITTYQSISANIQAIRSAGFDLLIADEAHKLRNLHGTKAPPQMAQGMRELLAMDRAFAYMLMLTATPIQNRLWDLYSLLDLLTVAKGHKHPLGSPDEFRSYFVDNARATAIRPGREVQFRKLIEPYVRRRRRRDVKLSFPTRIVQMHLVRPGRVETALLQVVHDLFNELALNGLQHTSLGQALMSSPIALRSQLRNMAERDKDFAPYLRRVETAIASDSQSAKLNALTTLLTELSKSRPADWRVVIFTSRLDTQELIGKVLRDAGFAFGFIRGGQKDANQQTIQKFRQQPPGIHVVVSTDSGAEGVNLQSGNILVNFDLPWNPMILEQRIGRIQRLASVHQEVRILNLVLAGSVEERVVGRLSEKLQAISQSVGDVEEILSSGGAGDSETFESRIRELVVQSLKGMNVERAAAQAEESIAEAKRIYEEEKATVEETLGTPRDGERSGPQVPDISPVVPRIEYTDFVLRALVADGARLQHLSNDEYAYTLPGQTTKRLTFRDNSFDDPAPTSMFGGNAARPFVPGRRDFEQLTGAWSSKAAAFVIDNSQINSEGLANAIKTLLRSERWQVNTLTIDSHTPAFEGKITCRGGVTVNHDRLEKLVEVVVGPDSAIETKLLECSDLQPSFKDCETQELVSGLPVLIDTAMESHSDFVKFRQFYGARLQEEVSRAGDSSQSQRLREKFAVAHAAQVVAVCGINHTRASVSGDVWFDGHGPFRADFAVTTSMDGVRAEFGTGWATCEMSQRLLPKSALSHCSVSNTLVASHLLVVSDVSSRRALPEFAKSSDLSGRWGVQDETVQCACCGMSLLRDEGVTSALSGMVAAPHHSALCEFTSVSALKSELRQSEISSRAFRQDQSARSVLSGRIGHISEFIESHAPSGLIARVEATQSEASALWGAESELIETDFEPKKRVFASEVFTSTVSGKRYLCDSGVRSELSGRHLHISEAMRCGFTGVSLHPDEVLISELSNEPYRCDQTASSVHSGLKGHKSEFVRSVDPEGLIAKQESARSKVSGKIGASDRMISSDFPPYRLALASETGKSVVSGLNMCLDESVRSGVSGDACHKSESKVCAFTQTILLPAESTTSDISGKVVRSDYACTSVLSGRRGHPSEYVRSTMPAGLLAEDEAARSDVSGEWGDTKLFSTSAAPPHRKGLPHEFVTCELSQQRLLRDEVGRCAVTGKQVNAQLLAKSADSEQLALPDQMAICQFSGKRVLPSELVRCAATGQRVAASETMKGAESDDMALRSSFVRCAATGEYALQSQVIQCPITGGPVRASQSRVCDITGRRVFIKHTKKCAVTGARYLEDPESHKAMRKRTGSQSLTEVCQWTNLPCLSHHIQSCKLTGRRVADCHLNADGELSTFRTVLNDPFADGLQCVNESTLNWLRDCHPNLKRTDHAILLISPGKVLGVLAVHTVSFFGFKQVHAVIVAFKPTPGLLAAPIAGKLTPQGWVRV